VFSDSSELDNVTGDDSLLLSAIKMMLKKDLMGHQELGRALLPVFLEFVMISPKMKPLFFYNRMMKIFKNVWKK
jgi:hypothetical protein